MRRLFYFLLYLSWIPALSAMTNQDLLEDLLTLGEVDLAAGIHMEIADQANHYQPWKAIVLTDVYPMAIRDAAYVNALRVARAQDDGALYRDFITLRGPETVLAAVALADIYAQVEAVGTMDAYAGFMEEFPNSLKAVEALLRLHEVAFAAAEARQTPEAYDSFVVNFPEAEQASLAQARAYALAREALLALGASLSVDEREFQARVLRQDAMIAMRSGHPTKPARNFRLLEEMQMFRGTEELSKLLEYQETAEYREALLSVEQEQAALLAAVRDGVDEIVHLQGQQVGLLTEISDNTGAIATEMSKVRAIMEEDQAMERARAILDAQAYALDQFSDIPILGWFTKPVAMVQHTRARLAPALGGAASLDESLEILLFGE